MWGGLLSSIPGAGLANLPFCKLRRASARAFTFFEPVRFQKTNRSDELTCPLGVWACANAPAVMQHAVSLGHDGRKCFEDRTYRSLLPRPSDFRVLARRSYLTTCRQACLLMPIDPRRFGRRTPPALRWRRDCHLVERTTACCSQCGPQERLSGACWGSSGRHATPCQTCPQWRRTSSSPGDKFVPSLELQISTLESPVPRSNARSATNLSARQPSPPGLPLPPPPVVNPVSDVRASPLIGGGHGLALACPARAFDPGTARCVLASSRARPPQLVV